MTKKNNVILALIVTLNFIILFYSISNLSISAYETDVIYQKSDFLHYFITYIITIFGANDYAVRMPFLLMHMANIFLLYKVSFFYLKRPSDRLWTVLIYALLPGVNSAAILINTSTVVIFATLGFIYLHLYKHAYSAFIVLALAGVIDNSVSILYLALIFYGIYKRDRSLLILSVVLFAVSMYVTGGIAVHGKPSGYFVELLGVYGAIFSPLVFIFFFYALYRILIKEEKNILWFISFVALIFSLILSFRQRIYIEDFAPFVVISIPFLVKIFFASCRIRLPQFRRKYQFTLYMVIFYLFFMFLAIHFNKQMYYFYPEAKKHFAYKQHFVKELSSALKAHNIYAVDTVNQKLQQRLRFYGIDIGKKYHLSQHLQNTSDITITISYTANSKVSFYVSKIHNN